jgi:hypothetical protein
VKELVLAAILSFSRGSIIAKDAVPLDEVATDIVSVIEAQDAPQLFEGPARREAAALLLVAIAAHESGFSRAIDQCHRRGDSGRSRTMWQLIGKVHLAGHSYKEVCADRRLAARLALATLARAWQKNPYATPQRLINAYTAGTWTAETRASRDICSMWQTRAERLGFIGAYCHKRTPISAQAHREPADSREPKVVLR